MTTTKSIADSTYAAAGRALDRAAAAGRDGEFLDELEQLRWVVRDLEVAIGTAVTTARANGASWSEVGFALGISKQAAWEQHGKG